MIDVGVSEFAQDPAMRKRLGEHGARRHAARSGLDLDRPCVAQEAAIVNARAFGAEESFGLVLLVGCEFAALTHYKMASVQPVCLVRREQPAALPAIALSIKRDGVEPRRA